MKRTGVAIATAATLLASSAYAMGPKDRLVGINDEAVSYLDPASVKTRNGRLTAWIVTDTRDPVPPQGPSAKDLAVVDCANEQQGLLMVVNYSLPGGRGTVLKSVSRDEPSMEPVVPGSVGAALMDAICAISRGEALDQMTYEDVQWLRVKGADTTFWWFQDKYHPADATP